jgi:hypothetical protein
MHLVVEGPRMSMARRTVEEYTALLARAFNGAIEVDGTRIVAHPSGTLLARAPHVARRTEPPHVLWLTSMVRDDHDNDWSDV